MILGKIDEHSMNFAFTVTVPRKPIPDTDGQMDSLTKQKNVSIFCVYTKDKEQHKHIPISCSLLVCNACNEALSIYSTAFSIL